MLHYVLHLLRHAHYLGQRHYLVSLTALGAAGIYALKAAANRAGRRD